MVEHFLHTEGVAGSKPAARTIFSKENGSSGVSTKDLPSISHDITHEACYNWHKEKEKIPTSDWKVGQDWLRKHDLIPKGRGKITIR